MFSHLKTLCMKGLMLSEFKQNNQLLFPYWNHQENYGFVMIEMDTEVN